jgi:hypothetical protein
MSPGSTEFSGSGWQFVKRSMNSIKARFAHRAPGPGEGSTFIVELPGEAADDAVTTKRCNFAVVVG